MGLAYICNDDFSSLGRPQVHPTIKLYPTQILIVGPDEVNNNNNEEFYAASFTPAMTPYRSVIWSIESGSQYANILQNGKVVPKYYSEDPNNLHEVTIKCTSFSDSSITATKTIKVKSNITFTQASEVAIWSDVEKPQYNRSYIIRGAVNGDECPFVSYRPLAAEYEGKLELIDNNDGTAKLTVLTEDYLHQVPITGYNSVYPSKTSTIKLNINDFVIINANDSQNSSDLMEVFYSNGLAVEPDKMWQSEAYEVTSL